MEEKERLLKEKADEFKALCKPLNDWLQKNYDPHTKIIIETDNAEIVRGEIGVPFDAID